MAQSWPKSSEIRIIQAVPWPTLVGVGQFRANFAAIVGPKWTNARAILVDSGQHSESSDRLTQTKEADIAGGPNLWSSLFLFGPEFGGAHPKNLTGSGPKRPMFDKIVQFVEHKYGPNSTDTSASRAKSGQAGCSPRVAKLAKNLGRACGVQRATMSREMLCEWLLRNVEVFPGSLSRDRRSQVCLGLCLVQFRGRLPGGKFTSMS